MANILTTWISVSDIYPIFAVLSPNTPKLQIEQCVNDAELFDLPNILCESLITDIDTELQLSPPFDTRPELYSFYTLFVVNYLAGLTMSRYSPYLGIHATQWGMEQYNQEGFGQVTDKRRAEILNAIKSKTNAFEYKLTEYLKSVDNTLDGVVYSCNNPCKPQKHRLSFSIIGQNRVRHGRLH